MEKMNKDYHVIYFGDRWDDTLRRRQQLAVRIARMPRVKKVTYVELPLSLTSLLKFMIGKADEDATIRWSRVLKMGFSAYIDGIRVISPISILPVFISGAIFDFNEVVTTWISKMMIEYGCDSNDGRDYRRILWLSHPFGGDFVGKFNESYILYDCTERFAEYEGYTPEFIRKIDKRDRAITSRSDIVLTQTKSHCDDKAIQNPSVFVVQNAVDYSYCCEDNHIEDLTKYGIRKKPVLGFVGTLNHRTDYDLLMDIAENNPEWSIALVGDVSDNRLVKKISKMQNVFFLGKKPFCEIFKHIRAFDVCLMPYRKVSSLGSPTKLYDYLATGRPIVSTHIAGLEEFKDVIYIADTYSEFRKKIKQALHEPSAMAGKRIELAKKNSWESRMQKIWDLIEEKCVESAD